MDRALSFETVNEIQRAIDSEIGPQTTYHALRTRRAGARPFVDFHLLVPGDLTVQEAHNLTNQIEHAVETVLPNAETTVHIEPIEEPTAWTDSPLVENIPGPVLVERNGHQTHHPAA